MDVGQWGEDANFNATMLLSSCLEISPLNQEAVRKRVIYRADVDTGQIFRSHLSNMAIILLIRQKSPARHHVCSLRPPFADILRVADRKIVVGAEVFFKITQPSHPSAAR